MLKDVATGVSFTVGAFVLAYAMAEPNAVTPAEYNFETETRASTIVRRHLSDEGKKASLANVAEVESRKEVTEKKAPTTRRAPNVRTSKTMCDLTFPMRGSIAHPACF